VSFHHIGIVVGDLHAATSWWCRAAGFRAVGETIHDPIQDVYVQLLRLEDGFCIELIAPASEGSPVSRFLAQRGGGLYHPCFEVPDLDSAIAHWREAGAFLVKRPAPAALFGGHRVAFMMTPGRILVELVEGGAPLPRS
jgi:methylmalonyl-CoA/ethylmalonyl-CoA epimerase